MPSSCLLLGQFPRKDSTPVNNGCGGRSHEYDYSDPGKNHSANNRLMNYATYNTSGETTELISTTHYYYNDVGNVTRVVTVKENPAPGERKYQATRMVYATNGQAVTYVLGEAWDEGTPCADNYDILYAREFRYDGARQRYLNRVLDTSQLELGVIDVVSEAWSDYDGDDIYGDYTVSGGDVTQVADYEPGVGRSFTPGTASATVYYHQDMLGSSRLVTTSSQAQQDKQWYTAFGESGESDVSQRYGYAGAWGYQTDPATDGFPFMHVGARYYDPATGRFLQRDPIGIRGGFNVYVYVGNQPTIDFDPSGLFPHIGTGPPLCPECNRQNGQRLVDMMPDFDPSKLVGIGQKMIWAMMCVAGLVEEYVGFIPPRQSRSSGDEEPQFRSGDPPPRHPEPPHDPRATPPAYCNRCH